MRRPAHGATARPPMARPGSGYGRPARPGPPESWREPDVVAQARRRDPVELLLASVSDIELT